MALQRDVIQLAFNQGIDTKTDSHILPLGKLHRLENARQKKIGSFTKKNGSTQKNQGLLYELRTTETFSGARRLSKRNNEALVVAAEYTIAELNTDILVSYEEEIDKWSIKGGISSVFSSEESYLNSNAIGGLGTPNFYDSLQVDNYLCTIYTQGSVGFDVFTFVVIDVNTGSSIAEVTQLATSGTAPRLVSLGSKVYAIVRYGSIIYAYEYDILSNPGGFTSLSGQQIVNDAQAAHFDCCVDSANNIFYLAYQNVTPNLAIKSFSSLTSGAPTTPLTPVNTTILVEAVLTLSTISIAVNTVSSRVNVSWNILAGLRLWIGNLSLTTITAAATLATQSYAHTLVSDPTLAYIYLLSMEADTDVYISVISASAVIDTELITRGAILASRALFKNGLLYFHLQSINEQQSAIFLYVGQYNFTDGFFPDNILSRSLYGSAYLSSVSFLPLPSISAIGDSLYCLFGKIIDILSNATATIAVKILKHELLPHNAYQSVELSGCTYFAGANISSFDGNSVSPLQARLYPEIESITEKVGTAILALTGTYSFIVIGISIDAQGNIIRSAPSIPFSLTLTAANNNADIVLADLLVYDFDAYYIYRTTNGGTVYYYDVPATNAGGATYSPAHTDAQITANEVLYTDGGDLFNICPPATYAIAAWQDRLWALTSEKIRYSKKTFTGRGADFAEELVLDLETGGGAPTALAALNDKLLIFKEGKIYYTTGDGPNDQGIQGSFLPPREITSLYGALNQRTVLSLGSEVWFQSAKGYFKIDASFAITEVGLPIDYFLTPSPVTSIEYYEAETEVRISDGSRTYVFNTTTQQWATFGWGDEDQKLIDGKYWRIKTGSDILIEDEDTTADDGVSSTMSLTTGWINPNVIQGLQRVYSLLIMARMINEISLKIDIFYDYVPDIFASYTLSPTSKDFADYSNAQIYENDSYAPASRKYPYQWEVRLPIQKCEAVRFTISDVSSNGLDSFELVAMGLEVGLKKKMFTGRDVVKA